MFKVSYIKNKTEHKNKKRKDYKKLKTNIFKILLQVAFQKIL